MYYLFCFHIFVIFVEIDKLQDLSPQFAHLQVSCSQMCLIEISQVSSLYGAWLYTMSYYRLHKSERTNNLHTN